MSGYDMNGGFDSDAAEMGALSVPRLSAPRPARKPRVLLAGEFSAGKTRLVNALLGETLLPSNVTATALPPVWLTGARISPQLVAADGSRRALPRMGASTGGSTGSAGRFDLAASLAGTLADPAGTAFCLLPHPAPLLERIDLIDTPGNSDPNMPAEAWQRMLDHADAVLWCSPAVQAWRQSEKAAFAELPEALRAHATLLITHADRLESPADVEKVQRRVLREAGGMFGAVMMVSLIRDEDIARIRAHLLELPARMTRLPGRDHPAVAAALAEAPLPGPVVLEPATAAAPLPRRIGTAPGGLPASASAALASAVPASAALAAPPGAGPVPVRPQRPDFTRPESARPETARPETTRPEPAGRRQELRVIEGRRQDAPVAPVAPVRAPAPVPGTRSISARPARPAAPAHAQSPAPAPSPTPAQAAAPQPLRPAPVQAPQPPRAREIWEAVTAGRRLNGPEAVARALTDYFDEIDREFRRLGDRAAGRGDPPREG